MAKAPRLLWPDESNRSDPEAVAAQCRGAHVELRRDGTTRWLMYVNGVRRRDFASPYFDHAKRCAEDLYGEPVDGWTEVA